jgi:hypothetical protein
MQNHLEDAIHDLKAAEDRILGAVAALEREVKVPVFDNEAGRRRNNDLIEAIENCHLELMRKVRLRRRLLTVVLDRYTLRPTENDSPAEVEKPTKKAARKTRTAHC